MDGFQLCQSRLGLNVMGFKHSTAVRKKVLG